MIKNWSLFIRLSFCIFAAGFILFSYIEKQNELTELRLAIPALAKKVKAIQEENIRHRYEIERFENPLNLLELMQKPEFTHLKYPYLNEQIFLERPRPFVISER
jgi:hypothetical protein